MTNVISYNVDLGNDITFRKLSRNSFFLHFTRIKSQHMYTGVNRKQGVHDILFDILPLHTMYFLLHTLYFC